MTLKVNKTREDSKKKNLLNYMGDYLKILMKFSLFILQQEKEYFQWLK